jgi:F-type H+-transporting ATPase subunit epsilon
MTTLQAGEVRLWDSEDQERTFIIGGGILEVMPHVVTVLADTAVRAADVDEAAAKQAKAEAERELATRSGRMDIAEAQAKLAEAVAQLRALERLRRQLKRK